MLNLVHYFQKQHQKPEVQDYETLLAQRNNVGPQPLAKRNKKNQFNTKSEKKYNERIKQPDKRNDILCRRR